MLPQENSAPQDDDPLSSRPDSNLWAVLGIWGFAAVALAIAIPFSPAPYTSDFLWTMFFVLGICFVLPVMIGSWAMLRCKILADKQGLTFVGLFRKRFVLWEEITDFWNSTPASAHTSAGERQTLACIEVRGRKRPLSLGLMGTPELKSRIESEAKWAKVRRFEFKDIRDVSEWPKNFAYKAISIWHIVGLYLLSVLVLEVTFVLGVVGLPQFVAGISSARASGTLWDVLVFLLLQSIIPMLYPAPICATLSRKVVPKQWWTQRIRATTEGLFFFQENVEQFVSFDSIESYHLEALPGNLNPPLCVIETRRDRYEFLSSIAKAPLLLLIIQQRAINSTTKKWSYPSGQDGDMLGDAHSLWRGGAIGVGPKIYHYRTRTNRALLFFGVFLCLACLVRPIFGVVRGGVWIAPQPEDVAMAIIFIVPIFLAVVWGSCGWFFSALETDENGIRQRGIWGQRFLKWSELESYSYNSHFYELRGSHQVIRFGSIADFNSLQTEIAQRAPQAKGSWTGPLRKEKR